MCGDGNINWCKTPQKYMKICSRSGGEIQFYALSLLIEIHAYFQQA